MSAEHEQWLKERLIQGVEFRAVFPYKFYLGRIYYKAHCVDVKKKIKAEIMLVGNNMDLSIENISDKSKIELKIVQIFIFDNGRKEDVTKSELIHKKLYFKPKYPPYKITSQINNLKLDGTLYMREEKAL